MTQEQARYHLQKLLWKYRAIKIAEIVFLSLGEGLIVYTVLKVINISLAIQFIAFAVITLFSFALLSIHEQLFSFRKATLVSFLNKHYPEFYESADLLNDSEGLSSLQQLQKVKVTQVFENLYKKINFPNRLAESILAMIIGIVGLYITSGLQQTDKGFFETKRSTNHSYEPSRKNSEIQNITIHIIPPAYTTNKPFETNTMNLKVIEGSIVQWTVLFSSDVTDPQIIFSMKDSIKLKKTGKSFTLKLTCTKKEIYHLHWKDQTGIRHNTDFYSIEIIRDEPPTMGIKSLQQFTMLSIHDNTILNLKVNITDDYGIRDAHVVATVSKGSGESVKFREEKLKFNLPEKISGKEINASRVLDLKKLGLDPGDELYFYVEALDNKVPLPNIARTETYFIALKDTTTEVISSDAGLGVDVMPDYFRSQRQIIIDTEKLLDEKKHIAKNVFNNRSNALGFDQQALRMRYGQFMGEEFESPEVLTEEQTIEDESKNPIAAYSHQHDTQNEHNLVPIKADDDEHAQANQKENPLEAFAHAHDHTDEATFFVQSVKAKLKAALTLMWDAELQLRLNEPQKSLPYQYKILKLLKEIANDSRVYVHRTGFDPPPLKEEKRLSGETNDLKNERILYSSQNKVNYPAIKAALSRIEIILSQNYIMLDSMTLTVLRKSGIELATVALQEPGVYLSSLSRLKSLTENRIQPENLKRELLKIRSTFWQILPVETSSPSKQKESTHRLEQQFLEKLEFMKHE